MSKEINDNNINIGKELGRMQLFNSAVVVVALAIIFYNVRFLNFVGHDLLIIVFVTSVFIALLFEYSKSMVKKSLDNLVIQASERTISSVNDIQNRNISQRENNNYSLTRIKNIQDLAANLQKYSADMKSLTNQTREKTDQSLSFTNNEYGAVKTNIEKMFAIRHKIQTIAELILELSDFVQSISSTVGLVEDIAEQTNLLALNAAVEAARAGEHGKGFAVVASEIRKLADESKQATTKIISLINDIQQTANSTVLATEEGTKEIESGLELAHIISENIEQLINVMNEISSNVQEIIVSSKKISTDSKTTDEFTKEILRSVEESKKLANENESLYEKIETTSNDLKRSVI